jgi:hypothetical protein
MEMKSASLRAWLVRSAIVWWLILFFVFFLVALLMFTPLGWFSVIWLSGLPGRIWGYSHFELCMLGYWPKDLTGYLELGTAAMGILIIPVIILAGLMALGHRVKLQFKKPDA